MYSNDEVSLTISKWPFYLGDGLLVAVSIVIAFLSDWQLDGFQVIACVLSVALGAAMLVLPYITEYLMRIREERDDRSSEVRLLKKQLETTEDALLKQHERLNQLESHSGLQDQRHELMASVIDGKMQTKAPNIEALAQRIAALEASDAQQSKTSGAVKKQLSTLEQSVKQIAQSLDTLEKAIPTRSSDTFAKTVEAPADVAASPEIPKKEAKLLKHPTKEMQSVDPLAADPVVDSESRQSDSSEKTEPADAPKPAEKKRPESKTSKTEALKTDAEVQEKPASPVAMELFSDDISVSLGADLMMDDDLFSAEATAGSEKPVAKKAGKKTRRAESKSKQSAEVSVETNATTVEVELMGIGNKPFIRGSGGGLSWEKGIPMEFKEIGKWIWTAPADLSESVELQIYRNDKDADRQGKHVLNLGQKLEITPEF